MKLKPRKIAETVAEKILMASGYLTSIVIVLIVVFLFREGAGLFDSPAVEQGYVLAVNRANPVQSLTPEQIMQIFDADLTNWSEVGGPDDSILVFRLDDITSYATEQELGADLSRAPQCLSRIVADHPNMIAYLPEQYVAPDFAGKEYLLERQLKPEARKDIIELLDKAGIVPTSMMDISDGLSSELLHISKQSNVGCRIYEDRIPIDYQTAAMAEQFNMNLSTAALNGGEDYELLFTVPLTVHDKVSEMKGVKVIGHITRPELGNYLVGRDGGEVELKAQGWNSLNE